MTTAIELRTRMAVHEAGQAVARHRLGLEPLTIRIVPDLSLDEADLPPQGRSDIDTDSAAAQVLSLLAGHAAERAAKVFIAHGEHLGQDDLNQASAVIDLWGLSEDMTSWKNKAARLMREPRNRKAVHALADCLLARDVIDERMVGLLIRYADGECDDAQMLALLLRNGWLQRPADTEAATQHLAALVHAAIWHKPA